MGSFVPGGSDGGGKEPRKGARALWRKNRKIGRLRCRLLSDTLCYNLARDLTHKDETQRVRKIFISSTSRDIVSEFSRIPRSLLWAPAIFWLLATWRWSKGFRPEAIDHLGSEAQFASLAAIDGTSLRLRLDSSTSFAFLWASTCRVQQQALAPQQAAVRDH
jgi:hypothetical protein